MTAHRPTCLSVVRNSWCQYKVMGKPMSRRLTSILFQLSCISRYVDYTYYSCDACTLARRDSTLSALGTPRAPRSKSLRELRIAPHPVRAQILETYTAFMTAAPRMRAKKILAASTRLALFSMTSIVAARGELRDRHFPIALFMTTSRAPFNLPDPRDLARQCLSFRGSLVTNYAVTPGTKKAWTTGVVHA